MIVIDDSNQMIFWHEEQDPEKARKISCALMDAVVDGTTIDWDSFDETPILDKNELAVKSNKAQMDKLAKNQNK